MEAANTNFFWDGCEDYLLILLPNLSQKIHVEEDKRYRYIYFNRDKNQKWFVDYSNDLRVYQ